MGGIIADTKRAIMLENWRVSYEAFKSSGMTMRNWCRENGIPESTFTYRLRALRLEVLEQKEQAPALPAVASADNSTAPVINLAQVKLGGDTQACALRIKRGDTDVWVNSSLPEQHLRILLEVMMHAQ